MRKLMISLCSGALLIGSFSYRAMAADDTKTVEGELVDLHCFAGGDAKGDGHKECGTKCAKSGVPVALLVDGKAWTIATNPRPLADAMAKTVRVTGTQNAQTMTLIPEKIEVKDGDAWKEIQMKDAHHKGGDEKHEEKAAEKTEEKK